MDPEFLDDLLVHQALKVSAAFYLGCFPGLHLQ